MCLAFYQQLRSYGDGATALSHIRQTGGPGIKYATPGIQGEWFIHYPTASDLSLQCLSRNNVWLLMLEVLEHLQYMCKPHLRSLVFGGL